MSAAPRIAVLGSITLDATFRMPRFPLPGETLFAESAAVHAGGKGLNQAIAAARLGAEVSLIGCVGDDPFAALLLDAAARDGIDTQHVVRGPGLTGLAVPVVVPSGENAILAAPGANLALTIEDIERARGVIAASDALLLQFETPIETVERAVSVAATAGVRVILNPAPVREFDASLLSAVKVLVVNEVEAAMLAPEGGDSPEQEARALLAKGPGTVILTLGPEGGAWAAGAGSGWFEAFQVAAMDSVGAGDCFCGALGVALCEGRDLAEALRFAAAAAAISVTRPGAALAMPTRDEVMQLFSG